jgi:helicase
MSDRVLIADVVKSIRELFPSLPLHVFGLGQPGLVRHLFDLGVDSVDSSSYVKLAADGQTWDRRTAASDLSPLDRMHLALANLAMASQRALPLGLSQIIFSGLNRHDEALT